MGERCGPRRGERQLVVEIDAASGRVRHRYPLEHAGSWMLESGAAGQSIVVSHLEGGGVTLLSQSGGPSRWLAGREGEIDAAPSPDGGEIWSVNLRDDSLTIVDLRNASSRRLHSGRSPGRVIFAPNGRVALTVNGADSTLVAFDVLTKARIGSVIVAAGPKVIALSRDGRRAYVTHPERGALTLVDVPSMTVLASVAVDGMPDGVAVLEERRAPQ